MNLIDCHTHTQYSVDSEADIIKCTERAAELELAAYAITDHCECNAWYPQEHYADNMPDKVDHFSYKDDFFASVAAVTELKEKYDGRLNLICGVELGQMLHDRKVADIALSDERLDFVIGSIHQVLGEKDFYYIDYLNMQENEIFDLLERYFREIHTVCKEGRADVIGHITYCLRYMKQRHGICLDISRFDDIIAESFRELVQHGKGIEINTSGLRQGFGDAFPDMKYLKMYRELGGEVLTIGSDAHVVEDIGKNVRDGAEMALAAGFTHLCYFKKRQPVFIKIN